LSEIPRIPRLKTRMEEILAVEKLAAGKPIIGTQTDGMSLRD
jgi:hypothetical protein